MPSGISDDRLDALEQLKILIVDDHLSNVLVLERMLRDAGYARIHTATDPRQVVDLCHRIKPDLLMLGLRMTPLDSVELTSRLQQLATTDQLPILVLTGDVSVDSRQQALSIGARDVVAKPLDQVEVRFLTGMGHELRTPLNAILGFTGTVLMGLAGPLNDEQAYQLRTVQSSGRHLLSLINDLPDLATIESGRDELRIEPIDGLVLLDEVALELRPLADEKGLRLVAEDDAEIEICTDRRAVRQILSNLTSNAIKFTDNGVVALELSQRRLEAASVARSPPYSVA